MPAQDIKVEGTVDKDYMNLTAEYEGATVTFEVNDTAIDPLFVILDNWEKILETFLDKTVEDDDA